MTGGVAHVASGGGGVIGAVVVSVVLATVGCRGWCIGCWWWSCSWFVGSPRPAVMVLVVSMLVEAVGDARLRWLKLHGIKGQKVPKIQGLKRHQKNNSLACKKSSRF